jgi:carboxypeptidase C (cathepsin A)
MTCRKLGGMRIRAPLPLLTIVLCASFLPLAKAAEPAPATQSADPTARTTTRPATSPAGEDKSGDHIFETTHSIKIAERTLSYTAIAGTMKQKDESGKPLADMFFVAYTLDGGEKSGNSASRPTTASAATTRPVTFVFNGGPGAASVWLHLGAVGPKRIKIDEDKGVIPAAPPFELVDNESTWLDASDLVFIDPVGTGYSRPAEGVKGEQFYGVKQDIESVGNFIRLWVTRYRRWDSPKFLAGESYGTTRAAGLSEHLLEKQGISLNGIILISSVLNFQTIVNAPGNDLPYVLYLPTYAAAAAYHKKLGDDLMRDLAATLKEVQQFALGDYTAALAAGDSLPQNKRVEIIEKLSKYTGLPIDYIAKSNLRIDPGRFREQLLADQGKVIGRFDARVTGYVADPLNVDAEFDPSLSLFLPLYSANLNAYVRNELKFESDLPYEVLTERVQPWNFGRGGFGYLYVADTLRDTILKNPQVRVLFAQGQLDLATPFASSDYTVDHLGLPPPLRKNITRTYYPAGHMLYHHAESRHKLHEDVAGFIRAAEPVR